MTSISKKLYIDKIADIVNECNKICLNKIKMNPIDDVMSSTYID